MNSSDRLKANIHHTRTPTGRGSVFISKTKQKPHSTSMSVSNNLQENHVSKNKIHVTISTHTTFNEFRVKNIINREKNMTLCNAKI